MRFPLCSRRAGCFSYIPGCVCVCVYMPFLFCTLFFFPPFEHARCAQFRGEKYRKSDDEALEKTVYIPRSLVDVYAYTICVKRKKYIYVYNREEVYTHTHITADDE